MDPEGAVLVLTAQGNIYGIRSWRGDLAVLQAKRLIAIASEASAIARALKRVKVLGPDEVVRVIHRPSFVAVEKGRLDVELTSVKSKWGSYYTSSESEMTVEEFCDRYGYDRSWYGHYTWKKGNFTGRRGRSPIYYKEVLVDDYNCFCSGCPYLLDVYDVWYYNKDRRVVAIECCASKCPRKVKPVQEYEEGYVYDDEWIVL